MDYQSGQSRTKSFFSQKLLKFSVLENTSVIISGMVILVLMVLTTADVLGRYIFVHPIDGTVEISELLLLVIVWLAAAATQKEGEHVGMDAIPDLLKEKNSWLYPWLRLFNNLPILIVFGFSTYVFVKDTVVSYQSYEQSFGPLYISYWPFKLIIAIGCVLLAVRLNMQITQKKKV